jgi:hypothetical protein
LPIRPEIIRREYMVTRRDGSTVNVVFELSPATGNEEPLPYGHVIRAFEITAMPVPCLRVRP